MSSSRRKSIGKYFKPSRYIRKFGTAEKIERFINKYIDPDNNNKINIEELLTKPSSFTYAAIADYIRKNENILDTFINTAFHKLCKVYEEPDEYEREPFFRIVRGDIFDSKYEKPSFRRIKSVWVLYEMLKILSDKENKGLKSNEILDIFERKVEMLENSLRKCQAGEPSFIPVISVSDFGRILLMGRPESLHRSTRKRQRTRNESK